MILATSDDYDFPHIDWLCKSCEEVYSYAGHPTETRCTGGHGAGWKPDPETIHEYIDLLESVEPGDGIVISGDGPATLMGPVESIGDDQLVTQSIDAPRRTVRWERDDRDDNNPNLEWTQTDADHAFWLDVHHVETVEIRTLATEKERGKVNGE
ncbi:hypothetical protein [Natronorubrum daqingense]|uniref:Uncharacterized protein n=1 Tax=Natronorubrum daqingense TaxID=588898 RepID=A0A1P8RIX4_9EURY|nr:hypothetical protein [Natronorubrum daqingense]APX98594.1 hypothetical protein BB347_18005 [Natronorubrum daqingense]